MKELAETYGKELQIWIQAAKVKAGNEKKVWQSVEVAYRYGIKNIMA